MALAPGTRLGPYEITVQIGAGGMGEVYRATDANLGRQVAIKVLPEAFAQDAERLARFEREAKTLASLNHPNIASIYGFEKGPPEVGHYTHALVMELVEGPTLADRLAAQPIPVDEAVPIARQIAEALEAAHEQGIVHRDLKPANVKVRDDGTVKVLDFGLAKMIGPDGVAPDDGPAKAGHYMTMSPTITTPAMTQLGVILGTAAYMAPEQARGKPVDKRSDIWAFGCVLFEMLTRKKAFDGEDVTDTIAAVVRAEPKWEALPADVPASIRLLLRRCLEKDRKKRIGDIAAVLFVMRDAEALSAAPAPATASTPRRASLWRQIGWYALAMTAASLLTVAAVRLLTRTDAPRVSRLELTTSGEAVLNEVPTRRVALTPDGSRLVYVGGAVVGRPGLFVREMDKLDPVRLVADGDRPFVSPDGQWVGFIMPPLLKKVAITGGPSMEIAKIDGGFRGGTWGTDGKIIFATNRETGLLRVSSDGGDIEVLTHPDKANGELGHIWPHLLPGGHAVLFTISAADGSLATSANSQIAVLDLRSASPVHKILIRGGSDARYVSSGHLVYFADGSLRAVRFDLDRLEIIGSSIQVLPSLATVGGNSGDFDVAQNGTVVYVPQEEGASVARTLTWVDRHGKEEAISAEPRAYLYPRISPEGTRVALDVREGDNDIWVWDLTSRTFIRITRDPGLDRAPVWSADGQFIFYSGQVDGSSSLYRQRADGNGTPERLTKPEAPQFPVSLSPQGTHLLLEQGTGGPANHDLMILALSAPTAGAASIREAEDVVKTAVGEGNGSISPNGRWLAYQSNQSGDWEIYVQPFADRNGARSAVSTNGGTQPRWSPDGRELYYVSPRSEMMRAPVGTGAAWSRATPQVLFDARPYFLGSSLGSPYFMYDVAKDGRFLMVKPVAGSKTRGTTANLVVILNWFEELKRLVPAN
jgi:serine/threonine-protein kinase